MKTVKIRAKSNPRNALEVDQTNADLLIARGTWELVPEPEPEPEPEKEADNVNSGKPAGRSRAPRAARAT